MPFTYWTGEEVRRGDAVSYCGEPGHVEFIVTHRVGDPAMDWYVETFSGGGFMITCAGFGRVFLTRSDEDLDLVSRAGSPP